MLFHFHRGRGKGTPDLQWPDVVRPYSGACPTKINPLSAFQKSALGSPMAAQRNRLYLSKSRLTPADLGSELADVLPIDGTLGTQEH